MKPLRDDLPSLIRQLQHTLFGIATPDAAAAAAEYGRQQAAKYAHAGLQALPAEEMPQAVADVFHRMELERGQRLLEIGPGPHGGVGLIAALMGLHVTFVESARPFSIDVETLRRQLTESNAAVALDRLAGVSGTIDVKPMDNLKQVLRPYRDLVRAALGTTDVMAGDFAEGRVHRQVAVSMPFDHVVCTDVISPMHDALSTTTAATTTGGSERVASIVAGLARLSRRARSLYVSVIIPEENDQFRSRIAEIYASLDLALREGGRSVTVERVVGPSSSTVVRARLYRLGPNA